MGLKFSGDSAKAEEFRARRRVVVFMIFLRFFTLIGEGSSRIDTDYFDENPGAISSPRRRW